MLEYLNTLRKMNVLIRQIFGNCALQGIASKSLGDPRGMLIVIEGERDILFAIARIYLLTCTPSGVVRGFHAHRALEQYAMCVSGSCTFDVDDGRRRESVLLAGPEQGLYMGPLLWHEMRDFSADCVLVVLASAPYDESDYIRSYDEFKELTR